MAGRFRTTDTDQSSFEYLVSNKFRFYTGPNSFFEHPWNAVVGGVIIFHADATSRPIRHQASLFTLNLTAGKSVVYVLMSDVQSRWFRTKMRVQSASIYETNQSKVAYSQVLSFGAPLSMALLTLAMFFSYRRWYLLYYVGYNISMLVVLAIGSFHIANSSMYLWPGMLILNAIATNLFLDFFLNLRSLLPRFSWLIRGLTLAFIILTVAEFFQGHETYAYIPQIGIYLTAAIATGMAFRLGVKGAGFLFAGWAILAISFVLNSLSLRFALNLPTILSVYSGFAIETILFTVALVIETKRSELQAQEQNQHAINQLAKVFILIRSSKFVRDQISSRLCRLERVRPVF